MHCYSFHIVDVAFHFAGVNPSPHLEPVLPRCLTDRCCTVDSARGAIEQRDNSIACGLDLVSSEAVKFPSHSVKVSRSQLLPGHVAQASGDSRGADDVGEEQGGQNPLTRCLWPCPIPRTLKLKRHKGLFPYDPSIMARRDIEDFTRPDDPLGAFVSRDL
jgi:hypothetical protein